MSDEIVWGNILPRRRIKNILKRDDWKTGKYSSDEELFQQLAI